MLCGRILKRRILLVRRNMGRNIAGDAIAGPDLQRGLAPLAGYRVPHRAQDGTERNNLIKGL
jgi:hypothetical protein